jgi:two-component system cell cycle sensor histidine kinase/response regulator CckA
VPHVSEARKLSLVLPAISDGLVCAAAPKLSTILLVEDEGFLREVACKVLESAGYRVLSTRNAAEAKRRFRSCAEGIELLLTDVVLPGRDGIALANDLQTICPTLKTIFMSGYPENAVTLTGLHKQQGVYLHKPFSTESLIGMIRRVLESNENN